MGLCAALARRSTLVIPRTPMLGLDEVDPLPVPSNPAMMQQMPSVKIPLSRKGACGGEERVQRLPRPASCHHPERAARLLWGYESCNHLSVALPTPGQR